MTDNAAIVWCLGLLFGLPLAGLALHDFYEHRAPFVPAAAPSSSAPVVISEPPEVKAAFARQERLFDRCVMGGGHPVWGHGYQTVCLKPQFVEWVEDPHFPKEMPPR